MPNINLQIPVNVTGCVAYDTEQNLTEDQKAQARRNLGIKEEEGCSCNKTETKVDDGPVTSKCQF